MEKEQEKLEFNSTADTGHFVIMNQEKTTVGASYWIWAEHLNQNIIVRPYCALFDFILHLYVWCVWSVTSSSFSPLLNIMATQHHWLEY